MYKFFIKKRKTTKIDEYKSKSFLSIFDIRLFIEFKYCGRSGFSLITISIINGIKAILNVSNNTNKIFELINKKVILPTSEEIRKNLPSRSAKLRYVKKIKNNGNFDEFINKFKNLLEIEKIGKKLC